MYNVRTTKSFDRAYKKCIKKRGYDEKLFKEVIEFLMRDGKLPKKYRPHKLNSRFLYAWECHITSDWLLVWEQYDEELLLILTQTGTHSDIF